MYERLRGVSVLYVEDDSLARKYFTKIIGHFFESIYDAANGNEGFELFQAKKPDLVITDLAMPPMNGFKLIRKIREVDADVPIIITTAYREEVDRAEGADAVIFKPVEKEHLLGEAVRILEKKNII